VDADGSPALLSDPHRRRAGHLYGLIISGAVLATAPDDFRLARIKPRVRSVLSTDGVIDRIGVDHVHGNVHRAVEAQLASKEASRT